MAALPDYYEVLQVSPNAEVEIIQAAYKRLAYKWHPDRRPGDLSADERMKLLNEAYAVLSNPPERQQYDLRRRQDAANREAAETARREAEQRVQAEQDRRRDVERERQEAERIRKDQERLRRDAERAAKRRRQEARRGRATPPPSDSQKDWVGLAGAAPYLFLIVSAVLISANSTSLTPATASTLYSLAVGITVLALVLVRYSAFQNEERRRLAKEQAQKSEREAQRKQEEERQREHAERERREQERLRRDTERAAEHKWDEERQRLAAELLRKEQERQRRDAEQAAERKKAEERQRIETERVEREQERLRRDAKAAVARQHSQQSEHREHADDWQQNHEDQEPICGKAADPNYEEPDAQQQSVAAEPTQHEDGQADDDQRAELGTPIRADFESLLNMAEEAGYLTFDQVADQLGIFIWRDSPSGPIEVFPDSPTDRRKIEDLLAVLEDAGIRLLREGDYCFGYLPPKPWLDAANDDDEADKDDNAFESTAWQENAVRAMEGD